MYCLSLVKQGKGEVSFKMSNTLLSKILEQFGDDSEEIHRLVKSNCADKSKKFFENYASTKEKAVWLISLAILYNSDTVVEYCLFDDLDLLQKIGIDLHTTIFHRASTFGAAKILEKLLKQQPGGLTLRDDLDRSLLHVACNPRLGYPSDAIGSINIILKNGINVNDKDKSGKTPLMEAIQSKQNDILELLIAQEDVDVNAETLQGTTAMGLAIATNNVTAATLLLRHENFNINHKTKIRGDTHLTSAILFNNEAIVELLLKHPEINLNERKNNNDAAIHIAISAGNLVILELLITSPNLDVNKAGYFNVTPLQITISKRNNSKVLELLLQNPQLKVNEEDRYGKTALIDAVCLFKHDLVNVLLQHKDVDVNAGNTKGETAMDFAIKNHNYTAAIKILDHEKFDVNKKTKGRRETYLMKAYNTRQSEDGRIIIETSQY